MTVGWQVQDVAQKQFEATWRPPSSVYLGRAAGAAFREEMRPFLVGDGLDAGELARGVVARFGELDVVIDDAALPWSVRVA